MKDFLWIFKIQSDLYFLTAVSITAMVLFVIYGMQNGLFTDRTKMEMLIERGGIFGPLFFIFIQKVQVVVPIIPDGISCAAGVILFGYSKYNPTFIFYRFYLVFISFICVL